MCLTADKVTDPMHPLQCQIQLENHFPFNSNGCNVKLSATTVQSKESQLALGISFSRLDIQIYGGGAKEMSKLELEDEEKSASNCWQQSTPWNVSCLRKQ